MNKNELNRHRPHDLTLVPIRIEGWKRVFNLEPTRRKGEGNNKAVLNAVRSEEWLNAVLICGVGDIFLEDLDERELGYNRIEVPNSTISFPYGNPVNELGKIYIYSGKPHKINDLILPNLSYLQLCLDGAKQWSLDFYQDYLKSTFTASGVILSDYLPEVELPSNE
jgi:hypothetical protein